MLPRRSFLRSLLAGGAAAASGGLPFFINSLGAQTFPAPNLLFLLADDLGFADIGCFGRGPVRTPHLDFLAREGAKLTEAYCPAPMCSPSRAACLTGRTNYRSGIDDVVPENGTQMYLRAAENTAARLLATAGYQTALFGKWHLNGNFSLGQPNPGSGGSDHGFAYWFATEVNAEPSHANPVNFWRNGAPVGALSGYSSQILADEVIGWMEHVRNPASPFFAYVPFHAPHYNIASHPRFLAPYAAESPARAQYYANVSQLDYEIGRILAALDRLNLSRNTLVVFMSDNGGILDGGWRSPDHDLSWANNGPYRGQKRDLYEGGLRTPALVRFPSRIRPGTVSEVPFVGMDVFHTLCAAGGVTPPNDRSYDGQDFLPALTGEGFSRTKPIYFNFPSAATSWKVAMRDGDYKLLANANLSSFSLHNLRRDPGETTNLTGTEPAKFQQLKGVLQTLHADVLSDPLRP